MKYLALLIILLATPAYASFYNPECGGAEVTGDTWHHTHCYTDTDTDTHSNDKVSNQQGVGADILLYQNKAVDVLAEYKYDWANGSHSSYAVVKTNRSVWDYIKSFFKKD